MDRNRFGNPEAPNFFLTYSQTRLLLAEAIVRGWATGDAAAEYEAGIRGHMIQCGFGQVIRKLILPTSMPMLQRTL